MKKQAAFIVFTAIVFVLGLNAQCKAQEESKYYLFDSDCKVWTEYERNVSEAWGYSSDQAALLKKTYIFGLLNAYSQDSDAAAEDDPWYTFSYSVDEYLREIDKYCFDDLKEPPHENVYKIAEVFLIVNYALQLAE